MTGNKAIDNIILGLNAAVVLAATALVVFSHTMLTKPKADPNAEFGNMIEGSYQEFQKPPVVMEEIIVNLYSREARLRFLSTQMNIVLFEERDRPYIMNSKPFINDILIDVSGNMRPNELNSVTGRLLLEERIKSRFNHLSGRPMIKKILFTKFIVQ